MSDSHVRGNVVAEGVGQVIAQVSQGTLACRLGLQRETCSATEHYAVRQARGNEIG